MRLISAVLLIICATGAYSGYYDWIREYPENPQPVPSNTIGLWNFNSNFTGTVSGFPYASDMVSGNTHHIRLNGATSFATATFENGLRNIGGSGENDYGYIYNGQNIFPEGSSPSLTIEFWLSLSDMSQERQFLIDKADADKSGYLLALERGELSGREYRLYFQVGDGLEAVVASADLVWQLGVDYHIAACWDGDEKTAILYVNGTKVGEVYAPDVSIVNNTHLPRIANSISSPFAALNGTIDDLRISSEVYNFARYPIVYNWTQSYSNVLGTLGLWQFEPEQISGSTSFDIITGTTRGSTIYGDTTFSSDGKFGWGAANIGGSDGSNYIGISNSQSLFPQTRNPSLTVECWIKLNSISQTTQYIIDKAYSDKSGYNLRLNRFVGVPEASYRLHFEVGNGSKTADVWAKLVWETGRYYHIAGVWDSVDDTAYLYRDGVEVARVTMPGMSIVNNSRSVKIGNRIASSYAALNGVIDEVRISDISYKYDLHGCGQIGTVYYPEDISGIDGKSDCRVDFYDFAIIASQWQKEVEFSEMVEEVEAFFAPVPPIAENYDEDKIYPLGRKMLFSMYSLNSPDIERAPFEYHTAIGPYYGDIAGQSAHLSSARANGLSIVYRVGIELNYDEPGWSIPSNSEITTIVTQQVNAVKDNPDICMWALASEELRYWEPEEMRLLQTAYNAIRAADTAGRPVFMYEPNHRTANSLALTLPYQDACGKGSYVNYVSKKTDRVWVKWSIEQEMAAISNVKPGAMALMLAEMYTDPPEEDWGLIRNWNRHDLYLGLIEGAKGILIWSGTRNRTNFRYTYDDYYFGYGSVARELNGEMSLGEVFLFGQRKDDVNVYISSGPQTLSYTYREVDYTYPAVNFANIAYGRGRYLFLVNSANVPVSINVSGFPEEKILIRNVFDDGDFEQLIGGNFDLNFTPLEVKCVRIVPLPTHCFR